MSNLVLKHFPGWEDYSYVSVAHQERYLLRLERHERQIKTERIRKFQQTDTQRIHDVMTKDRGPRQALDEDQLPVSSYSSDSAFGSSTRTVTPSHRVAPKIVAVPNCNKPLFLSSVGWSFPVHYLLQAWRTCTQAWTWIQNVLFPRTYFRGRDLRCKPQLRIPTTVE